MIANYGRQILQALKYLHANNFYHLHLHCGNILVDDKFNKIKLTELENFVCNLPVKNEQFFNFIFDDLNYNRNEISNNSKKTQLQKFENNHKNNNTNDNTNLFTDIFKNQFNIFEKIDIISFGRIIYEMSTGKDLKSAFPDEIELNDMDIDIANVLKIIFSRARNNNLNYKDISIKDLLNMKLFNNNNEEDIHIQNEKDESNIILFLFFINYLMY